MKKIGRMLAALLAAVLLCAAMGVLFAACGEGTEEPPQTDPVKVADGIDFDLAVGAEREFAVADYITANGNTVSASSAEETVASAAVEGGTLTVSALSAGETDVTLTCGDVTVTYGVPHVHGQRGRRGDAGARERHVHAARGARARGREYAVRGMAGG